MKNPFKEILLDEKLPEYIKEKVMADISVIKLSIDIADLFLVKYPEVFTESLFNNESKSDNDGEL